MPIIKPDTLPTTVSKDALRDMVKQGASEKSHGETLLNVALGVGGVMLLAHLLGKTTDDKQRFSSQKLENTTALGATIRQRRQDMRLTQEQLATKSGVGARFITEVENGKATAEVAKILQVLDALNLQLSVSLRS
ncbi:helix-turn-helix transcriptional regulator [Nitratidesulfovibrio sp. SRB-5]|uniref:helix-turn-helix transcriptional regulator n=1 Tax=Nitratidesulfovibrio sp. SRB-5 TaxID=2872636 RepID=UPI001CBA600F|nr:helix-turn-helix transcriptional regulator [Nitratidesulfovibrio sp. SRB-5]MBZ2171721.1 helix-turn-helix transcriptional regulator [Nitratidesulfovibrio sp. SRB-5]